MDSSSRESFMLKLVWVLDLSRLFLFLLLERDIPEFPSLDSWISVFHHGVRFALADSLSGPPYLPIPVIEQGYYL